MGDLECEIYAFERAHVPFSGPWLSGRCDKELIAALEFVIRNKSENRDELLMRIKDVIDLRLCGGKVLNTQTGEWEYLK